MKKSNEKAYKQKTTTSRQHEVYTLPIPSNNSQDKGTSTLSLTSNHYLINKLKK